MICGFCRKEIPAKTPEESCGRCGGGCRKVHCPHCGYENPLPSALFEGLFGQKKKTKDQE